MNKFLAVYERYSWPILLVAGVLLPLAAFGAQRALDNNTNDVRTWLPQQYPETADYHWFRQHFGNDEFVVITWPGCHADDPRLDRLVSRLVPAPEEAVADNRRELFARIVTGPEVLARLMEPPINLSRDAAIRRLRGTLFGPDAKQTCAILTLHDESKRHLRRSIARLRQIIVDECGVGAEELRLGGPPTVNAALDTASNRSLLELAGLSGLVGLVIAWRCFRSWRLTLMVFGTGIYSAIMSLAVVGYSNVAMNAILIIMGPLVYVAAMSGAIHLVNYYRDNLRDHGLAGAAARAVRHALVPLVLATATTALGLLSLCYSELLPIRMFGVFSAIGIVLSSLVLFLVLPALLEVAGVSRKRLPGGALGDTPATRPANQLAVPHSQALAAMEGQEGLSPRWQAFAQLVIGRSGLFTVLGLLALTLFAAGLPRLETSIRVLRFFSPSSEIIQTYDWMETHLGKLVPMEIVLRIDREKCPLDLLDRMELVSQVQNRLAQADEVGSTLSAITFSPELPGNKNWPQPADYSPRRSVMQARLERNYDRLVETGYLARSGDEELWRISVRVPARSDLHMGHVLQDFKQLVEPLIEQQREAAGPGVSATYTGMVPIIHKAQQSLLEGLIFGFGTDLALIVVAIMLLLRHWSPGMLLLLTSLFPAAIIFGYMGWQGIVVDIGTVMTPSVALGVTVDDVVHFLLWFKRGIERGLNRQQAVVLAYQGCARAMYQSWGVIGLGLAMFALSSFTPTMRFGALMVTLLTVGLLGNLVFLPSLLAGPLGEALARAVRRRAKRSTSSGSTADMVGEAAPLLGRFVVPRRRSIEM